jgi:hypothetical protein
VTAERARGAVLYGAAALLLAGGGLWWVHARPARPADLTVSQWRMIAQQLLPQSDDAEADDTVELTTDREIDAPVASGAHRLSVVCVGGANSVVRISLGIDDSGRGLDCAGQQPPTHFDVSVAGRLRMNLNVGGPSPVIFRYTVEKIND